MGTTGGTFSKPKQESARHRCFWHARRADSRSRTWRIPNGECARTASGGRLSRARKLRTPPWAYVSTRSCRNFACGSPATVDATALWPGNPPMPEAQAPLLPQRNQHVERRQGRFCCAPIRSTACGPGVLPARRLSRRTSARAPVWREPQGEPSLRAMQTASRSSNLPARSLLVSPFSAPPAPPSVPGSAGTSQAAPPYRARSPGDPCEEHPPARR